MTDAWHTHQFAVIDFETTGADPETCMPVQIGVVQFQGGEPRRTFGTLVNPGIPIPAEAAAIHGITDEMVADSMSVDQAMVAAAEWTAGFVPCGYNGQGFDRVIWERFAKSLGPWVDPLVMVRHVDRFVAGKGRHTLETTCRRWGVTLDNAHDAAADCAATGGLLFSKRMRELLGGMTLAKVLERQEERRAEQEKSFQEWLARQPPRD